MGTTLARLTTALVFVLILASGKRAEAARIPIVYQAGEAVFESGPLPAPYDKDTALIGASAGYVCSVTGVFWSYFSIDDCRPAAIRGSTYDEAPDLAAAVRTAYPEPTIPFWADHGWKIMAGVLAFVVVLGLLVGLRRGDDEEDLGASAIVAEGDITDRPRTQFHMAIVEPALAKDRTAAFEGTNVIPSAPVDQPKFVEQAQAQRASQPAFAGPVNRPITEPPGASPLAPEAFAQPRRGYSQPITGYEPTAPLRGDIPPPAPRVDFAAPRSRPDVVPPPVGAPAPQPMVPPVAPASRPSPMVIAPHLGLQAVTPAQAAAAFAQHTSKPSQPAIQPSHAHPSEPPQPAPMLAPAQPMRVSPPSMPPSIGMPQPQYAHVQQPVAPTMVVQQAQLPAMASNAQPPAMPQPLAPQPAQSPVHARAMQATPPMPQPLAPQPSALPPTMRPMSTPSVAKAGPMTRPSIAVPMPALAPRPGTASISPLASAPRGSAMPARKAPSPQQPPQPSAPPRVMPAVPPMPARAALSGPPEMPPAMGIPQATPSSGRTGTDAPSLPVERRFDNARLAPGPIALVPPVQQYARTPGANVRPPANVIAPHLMPSAASVADDDAAQTSIRMEIERAATQPGDLPADADPSDTSFDGPEVPTTLGFDLEAIIAADAPIAGGRTDVMAVVFEDASNAAAGDVRDGDGPTKHDASGQKRARADYNDSRRLARGSSLEMHSYEMATPASPELLRATLRIEDAKPHPYVTTRLRRS